MPKNVGRFIAQMYSAFNPEIREQIAKEKIKKDKGLREGNERLQKKYADQQGR